MNQPEKHSVSLCRPSPISSGPFWIERAVVVAEIEQVGACQAASGRKRVLSGISTGLQSVLITRGFNRTAEFQNFEVDADELEAHDERFTINHGIGVQDVDVQAIAIRREPCLRPHLS